MKWIYDLETYREAFIAVFKSVDSGEIKIFEISRRKRQRKQLLNFLLSDEVTGLIGFNNLNFDYPVLHRLFYNQMNSHEIWKLANQIINSTWSRIPTKLVKIPQLDLYLIHHFDNKNRRTSLKWCEFFLQWPNLQDLPYLPHEKLTDGQIDEIIDYCINDVLATEKLYEITKPKIKLREVFGEKYNLDLMNANDPMIGSEIILKFYSETTGIPKWQIRKMRSYRNRFVLKDLIFDYIEFKSDTFKNFLSDLKQKTIYKTKKAIEIDIDYKGFVYTYGTGGIHGCAESGVYKSDDEHIIIDVDVESSVVTL